jgi:hypothetical protein
VSVSSACVVDVVMPSPKMSRVGSDNDDDDVNSVGTDNDSSESAHRRLYRDKVSLKMSWGQCFLIVAKNDDFDENCSLMCCNDHNIVFQETIQIHRNIFGENRSKSLGKSSHN